MDAATARYRRRNILHQQNEKMQALGCELFGRPRTAARRAAIARARLQRAGRAGLLAALEPKPVRLVNIVVFQRSHSGSDPATGITADDIGGAVCTENQILQYRW